MRINLRRLLTAGLVAGFTFGVFGFLAPGTVAAEDEGIIKYRQSVMKVMGGHSGAIGGVLKGEADFKEHLAAHAVGLAAAARMVSTDLFPAGSDFGKTAALVAIWDKPEDFKERMAALVPAADALAEAAKSGDMAAINAAFGDLGKNVCKACHDNFKEERRR